MGGWIGVRGWVDGSETPTIGYEECADSIC